MRMVGPTRGIRCCDGIRYWNGYGGDSLLARPIANAPYRLVAYANSEYSLLERIRYWHRTDLMLESLSMARPTLPPVLGVRSNDKSSSRDSLGPVSRYLLRDSRGAAPVVYVDTSAGRCDSADWKILGSCPRRILSPNLELEWNRHLKGRVVLCASSLYGRRRNCQCEWF